MGFKVTGDLEVTGAVKIGADTLTATVAELNYVDGVTSAIQTQIDSKAGLSNWGNPEGGYKFDGTDDYVTVPDNANLDFGTGDFSYETFLYFNAVSAVQSIISKGSASPRFALQTTALNKLAPLVQTTEGVLQPIIEPALTTGFKHIVVTHTRSGNMLTYVNSILVDTTAMSTYASTVSNSTAFIIGQMGSANYCASNIFYTRLYNRVLTQAEVTKLYNNGRPDLASLDYADLGASQTSLVTGDDSTFASDTSWWTKGTGTTIADGVAHINGVSDTALLKTGLLTIGKRYKVVYTVKNYSAGSIAVTSFATNDFKSADGTYSIEGVATSANLSFYNYKETGNAVLDVDDITVYPIGCVAEYLPQNAGWYSWIETQNGLHGTATGGVIPLSNKIGDTRTAYLLTTSTTPTMTDAIPAGWVVEGITMTTENTLTEIDISQETSGVVFMNDETMSGTTKFWSGFDHVIYPTADKDLVFKLIGNGGAGTHIYVNLKKIV